MFLHNLGSTDKRFKTVGLHAGLNLLVAERMSDADGGDSRNSTGKSSFVRILRYLLGGNLPDEFKTEALSGHSFWGELSLPSANPAEEDRVYVRRSVSPTTRVNVSGWSRLTGTEDIHVDDWRVLLSEFVFNLPEDAVRPTLGQLWGQLVRTSFGKPTKSFPMESDWETGVKLGYLLGLAPEILLKAGELDKLVKQRKAIRGAIREGAISHLQLDEPSLRAELATTRRQRDRMQEDLRSFKVDEQYREHQKAADELSGSIQSLNDEALALDRRRGQIHHALEVDVDLSAGEELQRRLTRVYAEIGVVLPSEVNRRFDEVQAFHTSVLRNREVFLRDELTEVQERLKVAEKRRLDLDNERSSIMTLLRDSVALDTFLDAQRSFAQMEAAAADLERRLLSASEIGEIDNTIKLKKAETVSAVRAEIEERSTYLDGPIALFSELAAEIYSDRSARLLVSPTQNGLLEIEPKIDGDASDGIRGVETFLMDVVGLISGIENGRAPRILVHDSHLFDAIDHRQVASCLNIGARLADQYQFQYVVTMNSDFLASVESEGAFDRLPFVTELALTDANVTGGLFGFRFD
ncbi:hypothetical protein NicSoilB4_32250 [Arthrobacter sp. NicSoilB4]|uniref:ABC-three component system protein n=1 Tax=Arthrobacter sp. NicSoilB4 TaxID=2830997 RepID=UPI001CC3B7E2|nr:ABC-three component system protein [Arthrobacter sp. NicSoilB4]BCW68462.1 hypothetical protein NicSoilB4_32250 [Arthrobacter sp. NicSoilB4]